MKRFFFEWLYLFKPPWDSGIPAPELVRAVQQYPAGRALDLGCGTGTNVRYLAEHGWQATGVDFVPRAIDKAKRRARGLSYGARMNFLVGDVAKLDRLPLPGPFDLALDMGCFHSLPEARRAAYAAGLCHWLKPGAPYLLYAFQPDPAQKLWGLTQDDVIATFTRAGLAHTAYEQGQGRPSAWYCFRR